MDFGFGLPTRGPLSAPQTLAALVSTGEELGFKLHRCRRPHRGGATHQLHLPLQRKRHIHRLGIRPNYSTMALLRR